MASASIRVDLFNPGQVFACLGFLEAANVLLGDAQGGFDWSDEGEVKFHLRSAGQYDPIEAVLLFLSSVKVRAISPDPSKPLIPGPMI
jgi:CRISPR-associated protein Csb3